MDFHTLARFMFDRQAKADPADVMPGTCPDGELFGPQTGAVGSTPVVDAAPAGAAS